MDDDQLREALKQLGFDAPITDQTRAVLLRKVQSGSGAGSKNKKRGSAAPVAGRSNSFADAASTHPKAATSSGRYQERPPSREPGNGGGEERLVTPEAKVIPESRRQMHHVNGSIRNPSSGVEYAHASAASADEDTSSCRDVASMQAALSQCQHRCRIAEEQLERAQREAAEQDKQNVLTGEHIRVLRENMRRFVNRPSLVSDTCFLAGYGIRVLANRAVCAMRCEAMMSVLWRQDMLSLQVVSVNNTPMTTVDVCLDHSVRAVKELIASRVQVAVGQQRLVYERNELDDACVLSEYGIQTSCCIHLVVGRPSSTQEDAEDDPANHVPYECPLVCVVDMVDIAASSLEAFVTYLYSAHVDVSTDNVCGLFVLSRRFEASLLRKECVEFIHQRMDLDNVWAVLKMAHGQRSEELLLLCLSYVAKNGGLQQLQEHVPDLNAELLKFWSLRQPE
ncbi:uncharacterized protein LOC135815874 [Sycon ciliatum]|uniref:uncharacterized protein LOC135815874 n=1 Tax=Sycon ciliatum TaxID=27933 RepID=UPI0020A862ED|eukprot:scpid62415/ scgid30778/ 